MSITRTIHGGWQVSDIIGNHLFTRTYYGFTKREAVKAFREDSKFADRDLR